MEVTVKDTVTVRPARPTPRRTLWTSNVDLLFARGHTPTVYFYQPPDGSPPGSLLDAAVLKAALAEVLVPFYPAAGRLRLDSNGRVEINCNGEGVVFVEAESNVALDEFGDFGPENRPKYMRLVPQPAAFGSEHDVSVCPLLLLQVTRFRCGGASLGVAWDHLLGDGLSDFHLINSWANTARGVIPVTPFIDRTVLAARDPPAPSFPHPEYHAAPSLGTQPPPNHKQPFVTASFRLTPPDIDRLKSRWTAAAGGGQCGAYEAIVAHTWRCACIARELPADQKTRVHIPVSALRRLDPPLPSSYLGNAVFSMVCDATAGEVTVGPVVRKVRAALARTDNAYLRSALDYLQLQPDLSKLKRGAHVYGSPNLNVNSWVQLPIYGADFGWGRPLFVGPARVLCEGMVYILPRAAAEDGLSLVIGLHPASMERFRNIFYDFRARL